MRSSFRKPSIKKSISAKTTGRITRTVKKATNPAYGKRGTGFIRDPQKALYNKVYSKTSIGIQHSSGTKNNSRIAPVDYQTQSDTANSRLIVTNTNLHQLVSEHPELVKTLHKYFLKKLFIGILFFLVSVMLFFSSFPLPFIIASIAITIYAFYRSYKFHLAYKDAREIYWHNV